MEETFDRRKTLARVAGDGDLLREVVDAYCEDVPQRLEALARAIAAEELEAAADTAHSLKGAATIFDAAGTINAAVQIETLAAGRELDRLDAALAALESEQLRLCRELEAFVREM